MHGAVLLGTPFCCYSSMPISCHFTCHLLLMTPKANGSRTRLCQSWPGSMSFGTPVTAEVISRILSPLRRQRGVPASSPSISVILNIMFLASLACLPSLPAWPVSTLCPGSWLFMPLGDPHGCKFGFDAFTLFFNQSNDFPLTLLLQVLVVILRWFILVFLLLHLLLLLLFSFRFIWKSRATES